MAWLIALLVLMSSIAEAQVATFTFLSRTRQTPGEVTSPAVGVGGLRRAVVQLNAFVVDYDDPDLRLTITIEVSVDGGATWQHLTSTNIIGGARGKNGGLPALTIMPWGGQATFPAGAQFRAKLARNKTARLGLDAETE